jgi:hypothetical protein
VPNIIIAAALGAVLGWAGAHATYLGWWTLLPWGAGAIAIGYFMRPRSLLAGAVYGFVLSFSFMLSVYTGTASVLSRVPFFALLGGVGAICAFVLSFAGSRLATRLARTSGQSID